MYESHRYKPYPFYLFQLKRNALQDSLCVHIFTKNMESAFGGFLI